VQSSTENVTNPYRYIGAYGVHWDSSPALYFMQARYYAPDIGRFITVDPVRGAPQDPLSLHRYLYVANDPAVLVDPSGLLWWKWQETWADAIAGAILSGYYNCYVSCLSGIPASRVESWWPGLGPATGRCGQLARWVNRGLRLANSAYFFWLGRAWAGIRQKAQTIRRFHPERFMGYWARTRLIAVRMPKVAFRASIGVTAVITTGMSVYCTYKCSRLL